MTPNVGALFDRRDVTAAREQQAEPAPAPVSSDGLIVLELLEVVQRLGAQLIADRAHLTQLCVTDRQPSQLQMRDFPVPGAQRLIVRRTGQGSTQTLAANQETVLAYGNENRLGLTITNAGPNNITLYGNKDLIDPATGLPLTSGAPQIILASGCSWDGRLGTVLWCGHVAAIDTAGGSVVSTWEV